VSWDDADGPHLVETDVPSEVLRGLLAEHAGEVPGLNVVRPSLEDVYLSLIGQGGHALTEPITSEEER
jgi:ABC-2 type transport system ATP-binding protein